MLWQNWVSTPAKCKTGKCMLNKNTHLHSNYPILSAFHHQRHQLDQNILQRYMFGTTLNIGTRLLVANSSCVSKGDWDRYVWKRLSAIFRAGSLTRCNNGWHRPVGTAEYNPAKGSTCQLGWGMWLRASPPANNKTIYINRNLTKKWFPVRMEDVPMTQTSVKPKEPLR